MSRNQLPRVVFIGHALVPGLLSTRLIEEKLHDLGRDWPVAGQNPESMTWLSFVACPSGGVPVLVEFRIVPIMAGQFLRGLSSGDAYKWSERIALQAIHEAYDEGVPISIGWGAYTKIATDHGQLFLDCHPDLTLEVSTTHGDAGTVQLTLQMIPEAGFEKGFRVALIGANGAIGELVSKVLPRYSPSSILLVGKPDKPGESVNKDRLLSLQREINLPGGEVIISQDVSRACLEHRSELVIVATNSAHRLSPSEIQPGAVVFDVAAPPACSEQDDWSKHLVLTAGHGQFASRVLPGGFGIHRGVQLNDVGGGGLRTLWGCADETIINASYGWHGHSAGKHIPLYDLERCEKMIPSAGCAPAWISFGKRLTKRSVRKYVKNRSW